MSAVLIALALLVASGGDDWATYYEQSDCTRTPTYEQTVEYCRRLADASPWVHYTSFGKSARGRELPLLIVDKNGRFTAGEVRGSDNAVFLIQACIHAGECDGKDAGMMLIRDIAIRKDLESLLDNVTILFMPIFNVDGHKRFGRYNRANQNGPEEMGWRTTATNLNLNRDYLKADTPEMRAWLELYTEWLPDFFADCHVTDGADYQYTLTYVVEDSGGLDDDIVSWLDEDYLPPLKKNLEAEGFPLIRYTSYRRRYDPKSGIVCWASPPRFSTGYAALQNRPAILIEAHMLKDYKTRVTGTYHLLAETVKLLNSQHDTLRDLVRQADERAAGPGLREEPFAFSFEITGDSVMIDFLGYEYDVVESDVTGGKWYRYGDTPVTFSIPLYNRLAPSITTVLPEAYIVPVEWTGVIDRLSLHGVEFTRLSKDWTVPVHSYRLTEPRWRTTPYEGRFTVTYGIHEITEARTFPAGSAVVDMNQRSSRVAANILEPAGRDAYVQWGFFNAIFEQKEYIESYVIEEFARAMLEQDPQLKKDFEQKIASDPDFAGNPREIRNWFYRRTPYWDDRKGIYPVGLIRERDLVDAAPR
jgi:hypothetical protein